MKVDFKVLEEQKERNRVESLKFMDFYADWLKKTPNEIWSKQHADFMDSGFVVCESESAKRKEK